MLQDGGPSARFADKSNLHKMWARIVAEAGIEHITVRDLRRTGITRTLLDNMPVVVVNARPGHQEIETTMRYYKGIKKRNLRDVVANRRKAAG